MQATFAGTADFPARDTPRVFAHGGRWWLSNGWQNGGVLLSDLWYADKLDSLDWTLRNDATPYDPQAPIKSLGGAMVAVAENHYISTDNGATFSSVGTTPFPRTMWTMVGGYNSVVDGEMEIVDNKLVWLGPTAIYDTTDPTDIGAWQLRVSNPAYGRRKWFKTIQLDGLIVLIGGAKESPNYPLELGAAGAGRPDLTTQTDVWIIDPRDGYKMWRCTEFARFMPMFWFGFCAHKGQAIVTCGMNNLIGPEVTIRNQRDTWIAPTITDVIRNNWELMSGDRPVARHYPAFESDGTKAVLLAGNKNNPAPSTSASVCSDVFVFQ